MDTNEIKEEVLEELSEVENSDALSPKITPDKKIEDAIISQPSSLEDVTVNDNDEIKENTEVQASEIINENNEEKIDVIKDNESNDEQKDYETVEQNLNEKPKKNNVPLIIFLSVLLVIDIAALVIYIIGIEKVLSFIK